MCLFRFTSLRGFGSLSSLRRRANTRSRAASHRPVCASRAAPGPHPAVDSAACRTHYFVILTFLGRARAALAVRLGMTPAGAARGAAKVGPGLAPRPMTSSQSGCGRRLRVLDRRRCAPPPASGSIDSNAQRATCMLPLSKSCVGTQRACEQFADPTQHTRPFFLGPGRKHCQSRALCESEGRAIVPSTPLAAEGRTRGGSSILLCRREETRKSGGRHTPTAGVTPRPCLQVLDHAHAFRAWSGRAARGRRPAWRNRRGLPHEQAHGEDATARQDEPGSGTAPLDEEPSGTAVPKPLQIGGRSADVPPCVSVCVSQVRFQLLRQMHRRWFPPAEDDRLRLLLRNRNAFVVSGEQGPPGKRRARQTVWARALGTVPPEATPRFPCSRAPRRPLAAFCRAL